MPPLETFAFERNKKEGTGGSGGGGDGGCRILEHIIAQGMGLRSNEIWR